MSRYGPADAVPPGALPAQRAAVSALAPRKRRMVCQLIALVAVPAVLGPTLAGLQITGAARSAEAYGQAVRLAVRGQQINGLAQAMEDERSGTAVFISGGRPAAGLPVLRRQYSITDGRATIVRRLLAQIGRGYPARTRASAAKALASIAELPGLRGRAAQPAPAPATWAAGGGPALAGLPRRVPRSSQVRGTVADQEARPATAAESAEVMRSRLASFQRGSRPARAVAQRSRSTTQPGQDG